MKLAITAIGALLILVNGSLATHDIVNIYTTGSTWIQEASATLVLGNIPNANHGDVALWSAVMMDKGHFLQGISQNSAYNFRCPNNNGRAWCNLAYTLIAPTTPKVGASFTAGPGSRIRTHYKLNPSTGLWDQNVYLNDKLLSTVSTSKGQKGLRFYISVECASGICGTVPAHRWENISVILNQADKTFPSNAILYNGNWGYNASGGKMSTPDNGKTWSFITLGIPEMSVFH